MTPEEMLSWRLYYLSLFDLETTPQVDVIDPAGIVESMALQDAGRTIRICLNASASDRTMSSRFLDEFFGAGVQHIAFATDDIFAAARGDARAGLELLPIPENYYDDLEARLGLEPESRGCARTASSTTRTRAAATSSSTPAPSSERFFFEIVERDGYGGFGAPNAPIRLAAQARLARAGPAGADRSGQADIFCGYAFPRATQWDAPSLTPGPTP